MCCVLCTLVLRSAIYVNINANLLPYHIRCLWFFTDLNYHFQIHFHMNLPFLCKPCHFQIRKQEYQCPNLTEISKLEQMFRTSTMLMSLSTYKEMVIGLSSVATSLVA